jgi:hypothetical protein
LVGALPVVFSVMSETINYTSLQNSEQTRLRQRSGLN